VGSELLFSFSTTRKFIQPKFTEDLQHSIALKPTVFEASNINVNPSTAGAKTYTMIRDPEDPQLTISMPKLEHGEETVLFGTLADRGPGRVKPDSVKSMDRERKNPD
jgi:hypothetical protein